MSLPYSLKLYFNFNWKSTIYVYMGKIITLKNITFFHEEIFQQIELKFEKK